jgi:glycosyltransferase involved in cell wall biosynthesis
MGTDRKILFISHSAGRTGAPMVLLHLLKWLKANTEISFEILLREGGAWEPEFCKLAPTYRVGGWRPPRSLKGLARRIFPRQRGGAARADLARLSARRDWGLIYSNTITNGGILEAMQRAGCPVISHVHELNYWIERSGSENWEQVKRRSTHYIAAAEAVRYNLVEAHGIGAQKISVVHEFIPANGGQAAKTSAEQIRKKLGIPAGAFVLGGSGAEFWRKGRDLVVHLLMSVKRRSPRRDVHFVWVGNKGSSTESYELWNDLRQSGFAGHYHDAGEVENPGDYFSALDAFVLLSREDPFPLVCLEAALLGKPILCFRGAGGCPELVEEDAGFVVPYLDLETMADKVTLLAHSADLGERLGNRAAKKVKELYSLEATAPKLLNIINQCIISKT